MMIAKMAGLRFAFRILARSPLLMFVVIASLGLGIGANTAIFSLLYQIVLRSLPVQNPQQLVLVKAPAEYKGGRNSSNNAGDIDHIFSYKMFRGLESRLPSEITGIASFRLIGAILSYRGQTIDGSVMTVSGGYFPVLGVRPALGRLISPEDDVDGAGRQVAVLAHTYWKTKLGGQLDVLNQPLRVNGHIFTIAGVAPEGFTGLTFGDRPYVFVPLSTKPLLTPGWNGTDKWDDYWLYLFARLRPGAPPRQAEAALNVPYHALNEEQAKTSRNIPAGKLQRFRQSRLTLVDGSHGHSQTREQGRIPLLILMASTAFVLLIAIANAANLLLTRAAQRSREFAIRTALGAARSNVMKQVLAESMLLSLAGGLAGVLIALWTSNLLLRSLSEGGNATGDLTSQLQWPVLLFALAVSLFTGLLCGLYPAWSAARSSVNETLRNQSGNASASLGTARVRKLLVCGQVAISAILLIPTGLFLKSLVNLTHLDLGLKTENLITFHISPELNAYTQPRAKALFDRAEQLLAALPGVTGVATGMVPIIAGDNWGNNITVEGYSRDPKAETHSMFNAVGSGYFSKLGIALLDGREFTPADAQGTPKVAIVNQQFARHFFGNRSPIGRKFALGVGKVTPDTEIVGLTRDSHYSGVKQAVPRLYYIPWRQSDDAGAMSFYVRSALPPDRIMPQIRAAMKSLDPDLPLEDLRTLDDQIRINIQSDRLVLQLSAAFAILATLLAMLGLYGVMAYSVARRTREIGIRLALGAPTAAIGGMVMRELLLILLAGLALGIPAALALARLTESQLFGVKSFDSGVVAGAVLAFAIAALFAGYLPTRRATRINATVALRYE